MAEYLTFLFLVSLHGIFSSWRNIGNTLQRHFAFIFYQFLIDEMYIKSQSKSASRPSQEGHYHFLCAIFVALLSLIVLSAFQHQK